MKHSRRRWLRRPYQVDRCTVIENLERRLLLAAFAVTNLADDGAGSLRQAVSLANGTAESDAITFAPGLKGDIFLSSGSLNITGSVSISAAPGFITIDGSQNGGKRLMAIEAGENVGLFGLAFANASDNSEATPNGGAINNLGSLTLDHCDFSDNSSRRAGGAISTANLAASNCTFSNNVAASDTSGGGAIYVASGAVAELAQCTFNSNHAENVWGGAVFADHSTIHISGSSFTGNTALQAGAIYVVTGTMAMVNTTVADNTGSLSGLGAAITLDFASHATIINCTITDNHSSLEASTGGIRGNASFLSIGNSIVAGNHNTAGFGDTDFNGGITSLGHNIIGIIDGGSTFPAVASDIVGTVAVPFNPFDPGTSVASVSGGPTPAFPLSQGNPAFNGGDNSLLTTANGFSLPLTDQTGGPRVRFGTVDIGAAEANFTTFTVETSDDVNDGDYSYHHLSIREAILLAGQAEGVPTVNFAFNGFGLIQISSPLPIESEMKIVGPTGTHLHLDAQGLGGIFNINVGGIATISGLTLTGANRSNGGAISNEGTLTLQDVILTGNTASTAGAAIESSGTLTMTDCTIINNTAPSLGGAINITWGAATLNRCTVANNTGGGLASSGASVDIYSSTFTGNTNSAGAAINNTGVMIIASSTISANTAATSGGGIEGSGTVSMSNTIVAANNAPIGPDIHGAALNSFGSNLIGVGVGVVGLLNTDKRGTAAKPLSPQLANLGNFGGPTLTMRPLPGSPAINGGDNAQATAALGALATLDQRGMPRMQAGRIDLGAVEYEPQTLAITGTKANDTLSFTFTASVFNFKLNGKTKSIPRALVTGVSANLLSGNDQADASNLNIPVAFDGGAGNDILIGGSAADSLTGGFGNDLLVGNAGSDFFHDKDNTKDVIIGGSGVDSAEFDVIDKRSGIEHTIVI